MAYKKIWVDGEVITAKELNRLEERISESGGGSGGGSGVSSEDLEELIPLHNMNGCIVCNGEEITLTVGKDITVGQTITFKYKKINGYKINVSGMVLYNSIQPPVAMDGYAEETFTVAEGYNTCKFTGAYFVVVPLGDTTDSGLSEQIAHYITPEMYGAKGNGTTDDTVAIQQAIDNAKSSDIVYLGKNTYKTTVPLVFTNSYAQFKCDGTIAYSGTESAIIIKKNWMSIYVDGIEAPNGSAIQLLADANSIQTNRITVNSINCGKYGIHLKNTLGGTYYVSYNKFWCWFINAKEKGVYIEANCDGICENWFWLGGITTAKTGVDIQGSADTDWSGAWSNRFLSGSFEGLANDGCAIRLTNTWSNTFANFRCEENYGKNNIVYSGKCSYNEVGLSVVALGMIDISTLTSGGENILRGKVCTGTASNNGYSCGTEANISKTHGITYNPIYANVYMTMSDSTFSDKIIKQCDAENNGALVIPTTIEPDYSTNNNTYTLSSLYSEYGSMAKGFPLVFAFYTAGNGKLLLKDSRGNTVLDNTDGKYAGKVVSVRWNGYEKAKKKALWIVQILDDQFATESYVQGYAQPKGNYLTSVPSEYVTETELNAKGYLTQHQDLSEYAKTSQIPTKTSQLTNDSGFLSSHQDISGKADKSSAETWTFTLEDGTTVTKKVVLV